jgi:hypothetical protein
MSFEDEIERYMAEMPEPKLELIDGRLIVGNGVVGSRRLLKEILDGYGTLAALALAPVELWREALQRGFTELRPPSMDSPLAVWRSWARALVYEPAVAPAGPHVDGRHRCAAQELLFGLSSTASIGGFGLAMGRDIVMKVGENAFTPDVFLLRRERIDRMKYRYCEEPADLVIEVLAPGHETQDRDVKRGHYAAARIPEYWLIDPHRRTADFLRLTGGVYQLRHLDPDGRYRPLWIPGLVFVPAQLWAHLEDPRWHSPTGKGLFDIEQRQPELEARPLSDHGIQWGDLPFAAQLQLEPAKIRFDEFASWCPEAKFEGDGDKIIIGGRLGTRNVLGMLLRTVGMVEAVRLLHPRLWVRGRAAEERAWVRDADRKARWWELARQVAAQLRQNYGWRRIAVFGDLTCSQPLHYWSELTLFALDPPTKSLGDCYRRLSGTVKKVRLDLVDAKSATSEQRCALEENGVEI